MPLVYVDRGTSGTQLDIVGGNVTVGFLYKVALSVTAGHGAGWDWTWHAGPAAGPQKHGSAPDVYAAKLMIEDQWRVA